MLPPVPPLGQNPEKYGALKELLAAGADVARVIRVLAPGDPGAQRRPEDARLCVTVLWVDHDEKPHTALMIDSWVSSRQGW